MPTIFGNTNRGCFVRYSFSAEASKGAMLLLPGGKTSIPSAAGTSGLLITSVSLGQRELVSHLKCFNDAIYTYVFGSDVGDVQVSFLAFLQSGIAVGGQVNGPAGQPGMGTFANVLKYYADGRISKSKATASLQMGSAGGIITGQIVGLASNTQNTETNIQAFTLALKTTKVQGSP